MKIAYITTYNAQNINEWSGLGYFIAQALEDQGFELDYIGDLEIPKLSLHKLRRKFYNTLFGQEYDFYREPSVLKHFARQIEQRIALSKPDVLFSPSSLPLALVNSTLPKVFFTDTTFEGVVGFYEKFSNYCKRSFRHAHEMEKASIDNCDLIIYSSDWAAKQAINNYQCKEEKIKLLPFGANVNSEMDFPQIQTIIRKRPHDWINLLFLGVDWDRKGGKTAYEVARAINQAGTRCELHVAGCEPQNLTERPDWLKVYGFVNKATAEGQQLLNHLMQNAHFLILPSKADCTPVVFSELNSYGVPAISTKVGGIPFIIVNNKNGKTFDLESAPEKQAEYILSLKNDYKNYIQLAESSYKEYEQRLNWNVIGKKLKLYIEELINNQGYEV